MRVGWAPGRVLGWVVVVGSRPWGLLAAVVSRPVHLSGEADLEVFAYDATADGGSGLLTCVSCNPSGQHPHGINVEVEKDPNAVIDNWAAALIPPYTTSFYGSRAISDNGQRVFFDSYEALLPADTNGKEDVYEWEAPGSGPEGARVGPQPQGSPLGRWTTGQVDGLFHT